MVVNAYAVASLPLWLRAFSVSYSAGSFGIREFIVRIKGVIQAHHATAARALIQIGKKMNARIQAITKLLIK
jgi:hypothetical protein